MTRPTRRRTAGLLATLVPPAVLVGLPGSALTAAPSGTSGHTLPFDLQMIQE